MVSTHSSRNDDVRIIGAGLAGLLAANVFRKAKVFEAGPASQATHKAVLRFRSNAVGDAMGIDFRPVAVHKGIYFCDHFVQPDIRLANMYSQKVIGRFVDRSIWNLAPSERFIAPEDLIEQLIDRVGDRIEWDTAINPIDVQHNGPTISTMPMSTLLRMMDPETEHSFEFAQISVQRWRVPNASVYQTVYFPEPHLPLYRASITGDLLIAEHMGKPDKTYEWEIFDAFGLTGNDVVEIDTSKQRFGKIAPIDEDVRRKIILAATLDHNIFSVGRFATWRNILLDEVLSDIHTIKRLISGGIYDAAKAV